MIQSDALSQRPDFSNGIDSDNIDQTLLPDDLFIDAIDTNLRDAVAFAPCKDRIVLEAIEALKTKGTPPIKLLLSDWRTEEGLIFFKDKCYVPDDAELRRSIVQRHHDSLAMRHPGHLRTIELVQRDYWWPGMYTFVKNYVDGCTACQQNKINRHPTTPPLMPITAALTG